MSEIANAQTACQYLHEAARLNREDENREGALLTFGSAGQLVMTGDMHGNQRNFDKLQKFCELEHNPARSVILHELIHQEPETPGQPDLSIDLLVRAVQWKCDFPDNVFFLQSNHELAQWRGYEITKGGRSILRDFEQGVALRYGNQAKAVLTAVSDYISSLPLAARTAHGVFMAHSLPDPFIMDAFDFNLFKREPTPDELSPGGDAYSLVWGRFHPPDVVERFARRLGVEVFLVGHTPQENGYRVTGRLIILASDHNHGVFLPIDLGRKPTVEQLEAKIRKFVSVA